MEFSERVYRLVGQIPAGRVSTYGAVAEALGDSGAARAVGRALNRNPRLVEVPCHRVVHSDGRLGGYVLGKDEKARLLSTEGVEVLNDRVVDFRNRFFKDFKVF